MQSELKANRVYVADTLYKYFPEVFKQLIYIFGKYNIDVRIIYGTKDIWCRDYMPVQTNKEFVKFKYQPEDHLLPEEIEHGITQLENINIKHLEIPFLIDRLLNFDIKSEGGNFIKGDNILFICDKIFKDNPYHSKENLTRILSELFGKVIFIPQIPDEIIGHADGMIRYVNDNTVLINNWSYVSTRHYYSFLNILDQNKIKYIELPNKLYANDDPYSDKGDYINYLIVDNLIVMQQYGFMEDRKALKVIEKVFPNHKIEFVDCNELSEKGGGLNCCTWTIHI